MELANIQNLAKDLQNLANDYISKLNSITTRLENINLDNNPSALAVKGSNGAIYAIDLNNNTCTCPHFQYRLKGTNKICKHLKKVRCGKLLKSMPPPQISPVSWAHGKL